MPEHQRADPGDRRQRQRTLLQDHGFTRYIGSRPELTHVRTRRRSPQTNGVTSATTGAIQIEDLWRELPTDRAEMTTRVEAFRQLYNTLRPRETLAGARPIKHCLADSNNTPTTTASTRQSVRIP